ncbi:MAG: 4Fe-4S binding protein [Nanobdellota archaeon]
MLWIIIFSAGIAIFFGTILVTIAKEIEKKSDLQVNEIKQALPGKNCGGCGYANCEEYAKALSKNSKLLGKCVLADEKTKKTLSNILGCEKASQESYIAVVKCQGTAEYKAEYRGIKSCKAALLLGHPKKCKYGCLGYGDCLSACEFDAIDINTGIAKINHTKCRGCGKCVEKCPLSLIKLIPSSKKVVIKCASTEDKKQKSINCKKSCIGCGLCQKVCPTQAIEIKDGLAVINYEKCKGCGLCAKKCPRGVIENKNILYKNKKD